MSHQRSILHHFFAPNAHVRNKYYKKVDPLAKNHTKERHFFSYKVYMSHQSRLYINLFLLLFNS